MYFYWDLHYNSLVNHWSILTGYVPIGNYALYYSRVLVSVSQVLAQAKCRPIYWLVFEQGIALLFLG